MGTFEPVRTRLRQARQATAGYPRPFWFLFWGSLVSSAGNSMVWPFITIYMRERLGVPLTTVGLLFTLNFVAGFVATSFAGPAVDRFGRKGVMLASLAAGTAYLLGLMHVTTLSGWAALVALGGSFGPLYSIGSNAMIADMVPAGRRTEAYALMRMIYNLGIAIGPSIGGLVTSVSYGLAFAIAAGASASLALVILLFVGETIPQRDGPGDGSDAGYGPVLRDRAFLIIVAMLTLANMAYALITTLLPVYAKEGFGVPESQYGLIMATNATMVVLFQYGVTRVTRRFPDLPVLAVGAAFYGLGVGSVAWGRSFPAFLASMVVLTIGELIISPTATALTARLAPAAMRGRYLGLLSLSWGLGYGAGPALGGLLSDRVSPKATWYGGLVWGLLAAAGLALLARRLRAASPAEQPGTARPCDVAQA